MDKPIPNCISFTTRRDLSVRAFQTLKFIRDKPSDEVIQVKKRQPPGVISVVPLPNFDGCISRVHTTYDNVDLV